MTYLKKFWNKSFELNLWHCKYILISISRSYFYYKTVQIYSFNLKLFLKFTIFRLSVINQWCKLFSVNKSDCNKINRYFSNN